MGLVDRSESSSGFLRAEANRCVSCGLCLPHCPTYRLTLSEADSPRGRIQLMNGVASGHIPLNKKFIQHMDRCLTCRACESVCPNNVAYGQLIDEARAMIAAPPKTIAHSVVAKKNKFRVFIEKELVAKPARLDFLRSPIRLLQKMGLQQLSFFKKSKVQRLISQLPRVKKPCASTVDQTTSAKGWKEIYPAIGKQCGEVGLFLGCVARLADVQTLNSTIYVLNRLGYKVHIPPAQTCCGAIHQHSGEVAMGAMLTQQNKKAFAALNLQTIITTASGCGVQLTEGDVGQTEKARAYNKVSDSPLTIMDISRFLESAEGWDKVEIKPLSAKVAVHDPCSLRNVLRGQSHPYNLLARIPGLKIESLAGNDQCCGAAGTYFFDQPDMASQLQADKLSAVKQSKALFIATSNIGCSMYIASGLHTTDVEVFHPVTLLARQMGIQ